MPMMTTCTRRSSLICAMVAFTSSMAPVSRSRFKMVNAPKTMIPSSARLMIPLRSANTPASATIIRGTA